ncbi:MAG: TonB-dependent receptor [Nitrospinota bacterium]|nr:TonB-dependent receptor [Nitrospinota bacterium]
MIRAKWYLLLLCAAINISSSQLVLAQENGDQKEEYEITVTGAREEEKKSHTAATVDMVKAEKIQDVKPAHPAEIVNRVPGALVVVTGGEGHMTSIRHPITTNSVYLYLEDGIPIRSTGFFNHNALYEVNMPMAGGLEVTKGPGSALYGSDAVGGIVNSLTRPAPTTGEAEVNIEGGSFGWARTLLTTGNTWGNNGVRADVNVTHTDGWRDSTNYDRQSATLRHDGFLWDSVAVKSVLTYSKIDQQTAGTTQISEEDYTNNPTMNIAPISWRKVEALRFSVSADWETADSLLNITPYVRKNKLDYIANWSLSYDPAILNSGNDSLGLLVKYRRNLSQSSKVIAGVDIDNSPGYQTEEKIKPEKEGKTFISYTSDGAMLYDYDVTYTGVSPYLHLETSPWESLHLTAGARYDSMGYKYTNNLDDVSSGNWRRPADTSVSYSALTPKVGAVYEFNPAFNAFMSYKNAFRAPSQSQVFRQGKASNTVNLKPVKVDSYETGFRWNPGHGTQLELSLYDMVKKDDILSFTHPDKSSEVVNAGQTTHQGVELGAKKQLGDQVELNLAFSYSSHKYTDWKPNETTDLSGKEMAAAPKVTGNAQVSYKPDFLPGSALELEWIKIGEFWLDDANTEKYAGHDLYNARVSYSMGALKLYARVMNIADTRWATGGSFTERNGREFAPGNPLSFFGGATYSFK